MAPKADRDEIQDSSSCVILPDVSGDSSDLKSSRFGPVNPMTIPNMNAVKFTEVEKWNQWKLWVNKQCNNIAITADNVKQVAQIKWFIRSFELFLLQILIICHVKMNESYNLLTRN